VTIHSWFGLGLAVLSLCCTSCGRGHTSTIQGAGATFPAPLYKRWFLEYYQRHPDVRINYQAIGSGAGIRQFTSGLIDFAASDAAMSDAEIKAFEQKQPGRGVVMLPLTAGFSWGRSHSGTTRF
jgi:phosphate transport system substrate-binding protein